MIFTIDPRIASSSFFVGDLSLSSLYLKNDANFPWLILVPRVAEAREIMTLSPSQQYQLMDEITLVSQALQQHSTPDKLNVGALGNIVEQLHIHIIGRYQNDLLWPHSVWQAGLASLDYQEAKLQEMLHFFHNRLIFLPTAQ